METLILILITGVITGWLVSVSIRGSYTMLVANVFFGAMGAYFGNWIATQFSLLNFSSELMNSNGGVFATIVVSAIGALILLQMVQKVRLLT